MIQNLSTDTPLEEMRKTLFRDGVFKIDNYLKGSDLTSLYDEVYDISFFYCTCPNCLEVPVLSYSPRSERRKQRMNV